MKAYSPNILKGSKRLKHGEDNLIMDYEPLLLFLGSKDQSFSKMFRIQSYI